MSPIEWIDPKWLHDRLKLQLDGGPVACPGQSRLSGPIHPSNTGRLSFLAAAAAMVTCLIGQAQADAPTPPSKPDPIEHWELDFDSGVLWSVGSRSSPLDYTFLPQIITLKTDPIMRRKLGSGDLVVRNRFSLLAEPIVHGPETHFIGIVAAPSIEWWNPERNFSAFFSIGGGFGWMDSQGYAIAGAQGQDFNFTWFMHGGVRYRLTDNLSASLGLYFQHISNGNMDQVNPGVDALGPTLGIGWHF